MARQRCGTVGPPCVTCALRYGRAPFEYLCAQLLGAFRLEFVEGAAAFVLLLLVHKNQRLLCDPTPAQLIFVQQCILWIDCCLDFSKAI